MTSDEDHSRSAAPADAALAEAPAPEPPVPDAPVRAVWSAQPPTAPWCPPEWLEHLRLVEPTFVAPVGDTEASQELAAHDLVVSGNDGSWLLASACRRGRLHAHRGEHREDAAAFGGVTRAGVAVWWGAVADGAGSAAYSRIGSALAVHAATRACASGAGATGANSRTAAAVLHEAASAAQQALSEFAARAGLAKRDLRTTLLVALCTGTEIGVMHVGDGGTVLFGTDGSATLPTAGHAGDFSGEVAHFLPDDGALEMLVASVRVTPVRASSGGTSSGGTSSGGNSSGGTSSELAGVLLVTDGIEDPWYPLTRSSGLLFTQLAHGITDANADAAGVTQAMRGPVLTGEAPGIALGTWLGFEKRGENDDRTIFAAIRRDVAWPSA